MNQSPRQAESFRWSRNPPTFMKPKVALPHSKGTAT